MSGWGMGFMWIFWIVILVAIALVLRWVFTSGRGSDGSSESPEDILKARYARGEIDREEYDRRLEDLRR